MNRLQEQNSSLLRWLYSLSHRAMLFIKIHKIWKCTELTHETRESGIKRLTAVIKNKFDKKSWTNAKGCAMIPP